MKFEIIFASVHMSYSDDFALPSEIQIQYLADMYISSRNGKRDLEVFLGFFLT